LKGGPLIRYHPLRRRSPLRNLLSAFFFLLISPVSRRRSRPRPRRFPSIPLTCEGRENEIQIRQFYRGLSLSLSLSLSLARSLDRASCSQIKMQSQHFAIGLSNEESTNVTEVPRNTIFVRIGTREEPSRLRREFWRNASDFYIP